LVDNGDPTTVAYIQAAVNAGEVTAYGSASYNPSDAYYLVIETFTGVGPSTRVGYTGSITRIRVTAMVNSSELAKARIPSPPDNKTDVKVKLPVELEWTPGDYAVSHNVYLGTDETDVQNATVLTGDADGSGEVAFGDIYLLSEQWTNNTPASGPSADWDDDGDVDLADYAIIAGNFGASGDGIFRGHFALDANGYSPADLEINTEYFWRIAEVNNANGSSPWAGDLWSFETNRWQMPEFMTNLALLRVTDPNLWIYGVNDVELLTAVADANFNTVSFGFADFGDHLELCRGLGLKIIDSANTSLAASLIDDDVVWGYYVVDEPHYPYTGAPEAVEAMHAADPTHPGYVNIAGLPHDYHPQYLDMVNPEMLSFTGGYQWTHGRGPFFPDLEGHRDMALAAAIPMMRWITNETIEKIRHSAYASIAYGVKGIQFWHNGSVFERVGSSPEIWGTTLTAEGQNSADLCGELAIIGPALMPLESKEVFHTNPLPVYTRAIPQDYWVNIDDDEIVMGIFTDSNEDDFIVVDNRNITASPTITLEFLGVDEVKKFNKSAGGWTTLTLTDSGEKQSVDLTLAEGDGELLSVNRIPSRASRPQPFDGRDAGVKYNDTTLSWEAGYGSICSDVYFGTSFSDVNNANRATPGTYKGRQNQNSYDPGTMAIGQEYFWRIDAVDADLNVIKGDVWSFTAAKFIEILGEWTQGLTHAAEAGTNRLLLFTAHNEGSQVLNSVSYGGQAMTKVIDKTVASLALVSVYMLDEAGIASATGDTFAVNWSSPVDRMGYSSGFLSNVNQAYPIGASATNSSESGDDVDDLISTVPLSTNIGDMVMAMGSTGQPNAYDCKNGFTTAIELLIDNADGIVGYKIGGGNDETPSIHHAEPKRQVIVGFVVQYDPD